MRHQALEDLRHPLIPMAPSPARQLHRLVARQHPPETSGLPSNQEVPDSLPLDTGLLWHRYPRCDSVKGRIMAPGCRRPLRAIRCWRSRCRLSPFGVYRRWPRTTWAGMGPQDPDSSFRGTFSLSTRLSSSTFSVSCGMTSSAKKRTSAAMGFIALRAVALLAAKKSSRHVALWPIARDLG